MHAELVARNPIHQPTVFSIRRTAVVAERAIFHAYHVDPLMNAFHL